MKRLFSIIGLFWVSFLGWTDPCRYQWRSFGGVNTDMTPLFQWWTFVSKSTLKPIDITDMSSNTLLQVSNLWRHLPAKPLPQWCQIKAESISVAGQYWLIEAEVRPAPMLVQHVKIYLAEPPATEIENFNWAKSEIVSLQNAQAADNANYSDLDRYDRANSADFNRMLFLNDALPGNSTIIGQARSDALSERQTENNMNNTAARIQSRATEIANLQQFLRLFPGPNYSIDLFALHTGKSIGGIPIYDLGASAGLNYPAQ